MRGCGCFASDWGHLIAGCQLHVDGVACSGLGHDGLLTVPRASVFIHCGAPGILGCSDAVGHGEREGYMQVYLTVYLKVHSSSQAIPSGPLRTRQLGAVDTERERENGNGVTRVEDDRLLTLVHQLPTARWTELGCCLRDFQCVYVAQQCASTYLMMEVPICRQITDAIKPHHTTSLSASSPAPPGHTRNTTAIRYRIYRTASRQPLRCIHHDSSITSIIWRTDTAAATVT